MDSTSPSTDATLRANSGYASNASPADAWTAIEPAQTALAGGTEPSVAMSDLVETFKQAMTPLVAPGPGRRNATPGSPLDAADEPAPSAFILTAVSSTAASIPPAATRFVQLTAPTPDTPMIATESPRDVDHATPSAAPTPLAATELNLTQSDPRAVENYRSSPSLLPDPATASSRPADPSALAGLDRVPIATAPAYTVSTLNRSGAKSDATGFIHLKGGATPEAPMDEDPESSTPAADSTDLLGDAVLQSLMAQSGAAAPLPRPAVTGVTTAERTEQLARTLADTVTRVLVSDPLHDGNRELRIDFAPEVLPETSVRIWRSEGRLNIEFISTATTADSGLRAGLPQLAEAIQRQSPQGDVPVISLRLGDTAGQPGDGRSRQQYFTDEDNGEPT